MSNTLTPSIKALGTVTLPLAFNVGGTGSSVDLEDSKCFTAGTNTKLHLMMVKKSLLMLILKGQMSIQKGT